MKPSQKAVDLIKQFEGFRANAYMCPANVPTIGYGATTWPNGQKVKIGEVITLETAEKLLMTDLEKRSKVLQGLNLNQNQFDALLSFIYNIGTGAFRRSTILKKIKANPEDVTIRHEFMRWVNKGSAFERGLTRRRTAEANLYYAKI